MGILSVVILESIQTIGEYAFYGCSFLASVNIPSSVTRIKTYAFCGCKAITSITIPESITSIERGVFSSLTNITSVTIPETVTSIENAAFASCSNLQTVVIPESVTSIGEWAFRGCLSLTNVKLPQSLSSIGDWAFGLTGLTNIELPQNLTSIESYAFEETNITSITIPSSVTSLGTGALVNQKLTTAVSLIEEPFACSVFRDVYAGDNKYQMCDHITLYVPKGCKEKYENCGDWCRVKKIEELQESLLSEEKCWTMNYQLAVPNGSMLIEETVLRGDTIIDGIHCMKRYVRECRQGENMPESWGERSYIGQEGSKIYLYDSSTKKLNPIMDFSLNVGDVFTLPSDDIDLRVTAVSDTIIASSSDKRARKCIHLEMELFGECTEADVWVEGIGSLIYGITGMNVMYTGSDPYLESCVENQILLYSRSGDATGIGDAPRLNDKGQMTNDKRGGLYDLQGRRLTQKPEKGVYIENGRKRVK